MKNEKGIIIILFALLMPVLLGMMALAIDWGYLLHYQRKMQNAADAAALAGAFGIQRSEASPTLTTTCLDDAAKNGFDGANGETRTVYWPPVSGDFTGDLEFVEVHISQPVPTFFARVLGRTSVVIDARAVGGVRAGPDGCIYVLDGDDNKAFEVSSGSIVRAGNCGVRVYSCNDEALSVTSGSELTAGSIHVCGGVNDSGSFVDPEPDVDVCPDTGRCTKGPDPLITRPQPAVPDTCDHTDFKLSSEGTVGNRYTISPGTYCNGIKVESGSWVDFEEGIYYLRGGGLNINSLSDATGDGIAFFNTQGGGFSYEPIMIQSGTTIGFKAYQGGGSLEDIVFWDDRNIGGDYDNKIESDAGSFVEGILYFPNHHLMFHSNSIGANGADFTIVVANTLEVSSGTELLVGGGLSGAGGSNPRLHPSLVE